MPEVADVLRCDGPASVERVGEGRLPSHRRALDDLVHGRTETVGGPLWPGEPWGPAPDVSHACRTRRGPPCHRQDTAAWRAERRQARLPVPSVHRVCTVPHARGESIRQPPQDRDAILLRAAAPARITRAADPHAVGGLMGGLCVLHTWTRTLAYQPHVHGLVPAGGVSADRTAWRSARPSDLVPVPALATLFRGRCLDLVRPDRPALPLPEAVWTTGWVGSCKPTGQGTAHVWPYLGRSVPRLALTHHRRRSLASGQGCLRSQDAQAARWHPMPLPAQACLRRCRPHVWPPGVHTVRDDGLGRPVPRALLPQRQRARRAHPRPASYRPCTGAPSARLLGSPPPRRAARSARRPRRARRASRPPRPPKGPPCDPRPPGGFTPSARSRPWGIRPLAPWPHAVRRSIPLPGRPQRHHPYGPGAT